MLQGCRRRRRRICSLLLAGSLGSAVAHDEAVRAMGPVGGRRDRGQGGEAVGCGEGRGHGGGGGAGGRWGREEEERLEIRVIEDPSCRGSRGVRKVCLQLLQLLLILKLLMLLLTMIMQVFLLDMLLLLRRRRQGDVDVQVSWQGGTGCPGRAGRGTERVVVDKGLDGSLMG